MKFKLKYIFIATIIILVTSVSEAYAQEFSTSLNPSLIKIHATSPSLIRAPLTVKNLSDQNTSYSIFLRPFKANSENGEPNFDQSLSKNYKSFFEKISVTDQGEAVTEITLSPFQKKDLSVVIPVTDTTEKRDYYFTVVFLTKVTTDEIKTTATANRGGIGTNILLTVDSENQTQAAISKFYIPRFISKGPVGIELELSNLSDHFITSRGNLVIKNIFNQTVGYIEIKPTTLLENSSRNVSDSGNKLIWSEKYPLGIYKANLTMAMSDKGPLLEMNIIFLAVPIKGFMILVLFTFSIILLLKAANRKSEKY